MKTGANLRMRWPAMRAKDDEPLKRGAKASAGAALATTELGFDEALFEKLKKHRTALAQAEGVPPYVIFSNQTLEFLTRLRPTSVEAGLKIRGIGEKKAREYLPDFIQIISKHG